MKKAAKDVLREEYFDILPLVRKILQELEARIRYALIPEVNRLKSYERIEIHSRTKSCESAIDALRRRQEGGVFKKSSSESYTLLDLKDLAGVRVLVFPDTLINPVDVRIAEALEGEWESDPIPSADPSANPIAPKYNGLVDEAPPIYAEYQIVPMLIGLFWEVEHAAIYKPSPELKGISSHMRGELIEVEKALKRFDHRYEELAGKYEEKRKARRRAQH
jgi:ppGpp synthetase/RelA/SpoT-type nucleotidyltranferase